jgi:hypothetical protein
MPSLENPILEMFAESQFVLRVDDEDKGAHLKWGIAPHMLKPVNYAAIEPALRLVSRFLQMDSVVKFLVVMVDGELRVENRNGVVIPDRPKKQRFRELDRQLCRPGSGVSQSRHEPEHETVTDSMRLRAQEILTETVPMIKFQVQRFGRPHGQVIEDTGSLRGEYAKKFPDGYTSTVYINSMIYQECCNMTESLEKDPSLPSDDHDARPTRLSAALFNMADNLLHELSHAIYIAYHARLPGMEPMYENCTLGECGYAIQNERFGGILGVTKVGPAIADYKPCVEAEKREEAKDFTVAFELKAWPSEALLTAYNSTRGAMSSREGPLSNVVARVDLAFIGQLLSEQFWEAGVGPGPLAVPTCGSWREAFCGARKYIYYRAKSPGTDKDGGGPVTRVCECGCEGTFVPPVSPITS